ncbi:MAG: NAD-dependent epimerase/dehydratase family protein [Nitrospinota bacterium]
MVPSKVVVLGHTGFIGGALFEGLRRQSSHPVVGLSSAALDLTRRDEVASLKEVAGSDAVLIVASATRRRDDAPETYERNLAMLTNLADFLAGQPVRKCIYFSTASVYGDAASNLAIDEQMPVAPASRYGAAKAQGEVLLRRAAEANGMSLVILRPCRVYGPGDARASYGPTQFLRSVLEQGSVVLYGDGRELRDHVFVEDVARLVGRLVPSDLSGTYNVATGSSHSYRHILDVLRKVTSRSFGVSSAERTRPLIDQGFNIARLRRALPDPRFTSLELGIRQTYLALATDSERGKPLP